MSDYKNRLKEAEAERFDRQFASKGWACLLYAPGALALAAAFLMEAVGAVGQTTIMLIFMGIFLNLVSVFLDGFRRKIIRQDEAIRQLREQFNQGSSQSQKSPAGDILQPAPEE